MDEEETKSCQNCKREIPAVNFTIHSVHCARNIRICPVCKEPVPGSELDEHHQKMHKLLPCKQCGESVCGTDLEDHIRDSCANTVKSCRFCDLELPRRELPAHEVYCGVRTEQCPDCKEYVMIKYQQLHLDSNHGFIRLDDDPVPPKKEPPKLNLRPQSISNLNRPNTAPSNAPKLVNVAQRPTFIFDVTSNENRPTYVKIKPLLSNSGMTSSFSNPRPNFTPSPNLEVSSFSGSNPRQSSPSATPDSSNNGLVSSKSESPHTDSVYYPRSGSFNDGLIFANPLPISNSGFGSPNSSDTIPGSSNSRQDTSNSRQSSSNSIPGSSNSRQDPSNIMQWSSIPRQGSSNPRGSSNTRQDFSNFGQDCSNINKDSSNSGQYPANIGQSSSNSIPGSSNSRQDPSRIIQCVWIPRQGSSNPRGSSNNRQDFSNFGQDCSNISKDSSNSGQYPANIGQSSSNSIPGSSNSRQDPSHIIQCVSIPGQGSSNPRGSSNNRQDFSNFGQDCSNISKDSSNSGQYPANIGQSSSNPRQGFANSRQGSSDGPSSSNTRPANFDIAGQLPNSNNIRNITKNEVNQGSFNSGDRPSSSNISPQDVTPSVVRASGTKKRTNDQPQINMDTSATKTVDKDLGAVSRGAVKKRPAPPPPPPRSARRDLPYYSAMQRQQREERERQQQNEYNLAHGLPPVLNPAQKIEKLRKLDALQNRDYEEEYRSRQRRPSPEQGFDQGSDQGYRLGNRQDSDEATRNKFKDLKPMSPGEFMKRFRSLQVTSPGEGPAAKADRFPEIKSSLRELRRGLNEVTAPYNVNNNATANNNNNNDRVRSPSPEEGAVGGVGGVEEVRLPCEFCNALVPADDLVQHQTGCRPDLAQLVPSPSPPRHGPSPRSQSPLRGYSPSLEYSPPRGYSPQHGASPPADPVIPCEFCMRSLPVYLINEHQERCIQENMPA